LPETGSTLNVVTQDDLAGVIGRVLGGRYRLATLMGAGRFTEVFLAYDLLQSQRVVVKLLSGEAIPGERVRDEALAARYLQAAEEAFSANHPYLVGVRGWGDSDFGPYVVSEFMAGGSLQQMLASGYLLTPSQALMAGLEVARGLEHLHSSGHVHRDIRPSNICFDLRGRARLADFGTSWMLTYSEAAGALAARSVFTSIDAARYASPEQAQGLEADHKSDVYSLVLVLTEALSGRVPFQSDDAEYTHMAKMSRNLDLAGQFDRLGRVLETAGRPDREERPSALDLGRGLMAAAQTLPRPTPLPLAETGSGIPDTGDIPGAGLPAAGPAAVDGSGASRRGPRRLLPALTVILAVGALGFGAYLLWDNWFGPETRPVPDLADAGDADLLRIENEFGWVLDRREQRQDGTVAGQVLRQAPRPGTGLERGETVTVWVSLGPELVMIPRNLPGLALEDAEQVLNESGLAVGDVFTRYDEDVIEGAVIEVDELFAEVDPASSVNVVVSLGPSPRVVPEIAAGASFAAVREKLEEARLEVLEWPEPSSEIAADHVARVEPPPGTEVPADSIITVVVSTGPVEVLVPELAALGVQEARLLLEEADLCLDQVEGPLDTEVLASNPPGGTITESGQCVSLITRPDEDAGAGAEDG